MEKDDRIKFCEESIKQNKKQTTKFWISEAIVSAITIAIVVFVFEIRFEVVDSGPQIRQLKSEVYTINAKLDSLNVKADKALKIAEYCKKAREEDKAMLDSILASEKLIYSKLVKENTPWYKAVLDFLKID